MLVSVCNLVVHSDGPTLQDVQTNSTETVDVGVIDLGKEADLGWSHGVVVGQEQLELEDSAWLVSEDGRSSRLKLGLDTVVRRL